MPVTDDQLISSANLAAALSTGGGSSQTGDKPVSVDNLKAVLGSLDATTLYDGPAVSSASLSASVTGFDRLYIELDGVGSSGAFIVSSPEPSAVTDGGRVYFTTVTTAAAIQIVFSAEPSGTKVTLASYTNSYGVKRVIGLK